MKHTIVIIISFLVLNFSDAHSQIEFSKSVIVGAEQTENYIPDLRNKQVALVANQTSLIHQTHLVDTILSLNIDLKLVFCPEHGFRGTADAGEKVEDSKDKKTGLPLISLYGKHKKPTPEDLTNIDFVLFDIQDVGVRFYTYISTLHYVMEACAENGVKLIVLDRPNPNGFYVDGPVLNREFSSFVGMHEVPLVHGMTIGEYATMINGEKWLKDSLSCDLNVIACKNYDHTTLYKLPVKPSPNLPNMHSVFLYPSLGLFEGTVMSVGRGTDFPFQVYGHPDFESGNFKFTPTPNEGSSHPKHKNIVCKGIDLQNVSLADIVAYNKLNLTYLVAAHDYFYGGSVKFFNNFFYRLAGTKELQKQIESRTSPNEIRETWQNDLQSFKTIRKKYLLYPDFE